MVNYKVSNGRSRSGSRQRWARSWKRFSWSCDEGGTEAARQRGTAEEDARSGRKHPGLRRARRDFRTEYRGHARGRAEALPAGNGAEDRGGAGRWGRGHLRVEVVKISACGGIELEKLNGLMGNGECHDAGAGEDAAGGYKSRPGKPGRRVKIICYSREVQRPLRARRVGTQPARRTSSARCAAGC